MRDGGVKLVGRAVEIHGFMQNDHIVADINGHERDFFAGFSAKHLIHHAEALINLLVACGLIGIIDVRENQKLVTVFESGGALCFIVVIVFEECSPRYTGIPFSFFTAICVPRAASLPTTAL